MIAGVASTEVHSISPAEHRGGGGVRVMLVVHARVLLCRSSDGIDRSYNRVVNS